MGSEARCSAVSIPASIAEGQGRLTSRNFRQFLWLCARSLLEQEILILVAGNFQYLDPDQITIFTTRAGRSAKF